MGINGLLPRILPSAGRENYDLRALSDGLISQSSSASASHHTENDRTGDRPATKRRRCWSRRKVRIGVDVNGWIARAAHGHGGSLMDERHLSYHGRAQLRNEQRMQQQQHPGNNGDDDEQANPNNATTDTTTNNNNNNNNNNEEIKKQQRLEFISNCISFVLQRIEFLRDECCAQVLPVLDGATPPCKRDAVRERSDRRRLATEQRDEMPHSPPKPSTSAGNSANNGNNLGDYDEEVLDEAARTEAEVLRRISASKRAGTGKDRSLRREILGELLKEFRVRRWPFLVAPYEADGQLAHLANTGAVDMVVTEDSDFIALGVPTLVYKLGGWNGANAANRFGGGGFYDFGSAACRTASTSSSNKRYLRGTILHRNNLGSSQGIDLLDFTDAMLAVMFVAAGCDYCDSLKGIGVVTARNIVKRAFHCEGSSYLTAGDSGERQEPVLRVILNELFQSCHKESREQVLPLGDPEKEHVRLAYERSFLAALAMFRHPMVYDPISGMHTVSNDVCDDCVGNPTCANASFRKDESVLMEYGPYGDLVTKREMLYPVIGAPFGPELAGGIAEGLIDPRQLPVPEYHAQACSSRQKEKSNSSRAADVGTESIDLVKGSHSALQLSSPDFSGVGTQQSMSSPGTSGMISSMSPDLLAMTSSQ